MSNKKRITIILCMIFLTPLLGFAFGYLTKGEDQSSLSQAFGLWYGIIAVILGLIIGPIVSFLTRPRTGFVSLLGYITPPILIFVWLIYMYMSA